MVDVHFETDLCLLGLLVLLHLLDHRNLSLLDNLINDLQLRNLHDFLQSGCSTHLCLHFRIVRILTPTQAVPLHNWDVNFSFSEFSTVFRVFCVVGMCIKFREFLPLDERAEHVALPLPYGRFESVWTSRYVTTRQLTNLSLCSMCGTRTVGIGLCCT